MPAFDLSQGSQTLARYDVVGMYSDYLPRFIRHVSLFDGDAATVSMYEEVKVAHMGPPLGTGCNLPVHAVGGVSLTNDEIKQIEARIEEMKDEYEAEGPDRKQQYIIDPPWKDERDPNTGVRRYRRFSCAGFVLDAHLQVDIELLDLDKSVLPEVDKETLQLAYADVDVARKGADLERYGVGGEGPWRIVLAGYVLHALDRPSELIRREPYQAQSGDELFPAAR